MNTGIPMADADSSIFTRLSIYKITEDLSVAVSQTKKDGI